MKNLSYPLGMLLTILIGTWLYFNWCSDCQLDTAENQDPEPQETPAMTEEPKATGVSSMPFALSATGLNFSENDNFNFALNGDDILTPLSEKVSARVSEVSAYLKANPGKALNITGYYRGDETNETAFPNLGMARANAVKNYLASVGVATAQTNLFGKQMDDFMPTDSILMGPVSFEMTDRANTDNDKYKAIFDEINANPLTVYFDTGSSTISLSAAQREKLAKIVDYVDHVDGAKCAVIGHTDSRGSRSLNISLGKDRADVMKQYLIGQNIPETKIVVNSKGPDAPIADNATEEGRKLNRRTEITLLNN